MTPFAKCKSCRSAAGKREASGWMKYSGVEAFPSGCLTLGKVSCRNGTPRRVTVSLDKICQPFLGNNVGIIWGGRQDVCFLMYLGEQLSQPRRGWVIKSKTRDSWLNWRVHLGTKNLNLLDLEPLDAPEKYAFFSQRLFCWVLLYRGMNWDEYVKVLFNGILYKRSEDLQEI